MPNRTLCEALEEMRKAYKTCNFSYLPGLIEEVQSMGNRMESALYDKRDYKWEREKIKKLKARRKKLERQVAKLEEKTGEVEKGADHGLSQFLE